MSSAPDHSETTNKCRFPFQRIRERLSRCLHLIPERPVQSFLGCGLLVIFTAGLFGWTPSRWVIGIDTQDNPCLGYRLYVVDKSDRTPVIGQIYSFITYQRKPNSHELDPVGRYRAKRLAAKGGDDVEITADEKLLINGALIRESMPHLKALGKTGKDIAYKRTLKPGELFFLGDNHVSYDSRYWGPIPEKNLQGRIVWALFKVDL